MGLNIANLLGIGKGVADIATGVGQGAKDVITAAKTNPNLAIEAEVDKLRIKTEGEIEKLVQDSVQQARDFAIKYEGSAEQVPKWLLVVRSLIRPVVTILTFGWFFAALSIDLYNLLKRTEDYQWIVTELPQGFWWILGIILTFWFGGKVGERVAQQVGVNRQGGSSSS